MKLILHPDDRAWSVSGNDVSLGVADMPKALHALRCLWSDHRDIVQLPSLDIVCCDGVTDWQRMQVEDRLAGFIFDLGNSAEDAWWGARNAIANACWAASAPKQDSLRGYASGRPIICVASGPTATAHFDAIRSAHERGAVVICADSIFKALVAAGITPDFVCVLERPPIFAPLVPPDISTRARLICPPVVDPSTVAGWGSRVVWFWQETPGLYKWLGPNVPTAFSGRSAGTLALASARLMGGTAIYLVGHDLCRVGADSHAEGVGSMTKDGQAKAEAESPPCGMFATCYAPCRDGQMRKSTRFWSLCRQDLEAMCAGASLPIYAVDNRGAYIAGTRGAERLPEFNYATIRQADLAVTPSLYRAHLKRQLRDDIAKALRMLSAIPSALSNADAISHMAMLEPTVWAHADTHQLFTCVMGSVYYAASMRAHLRKGDKEWPILALSILQRGLPPALAMMDRDLC